MIENTNNGFVFHADNLHRDEAGRPPAITCTPEKMYLYFDNGYGEQWVAMVDPKTGLGEVRSSDCGWDERFELVDGGVLGGVLLSKGETQIIQSFWEAATGKLATSPAIVMAHIAECAFFEPLEDPSKSLKDVIENAKAAGKRAIAIATPNMLGRDYHQCMMNLRLIADAGLSLRIFDVGPMTAALTAKLADWDGDGGSSDDPDDDRPRLPVLKPSRN